eukprot:scaffold1004_cov105-Cylindrotheca_fusiformis.AAC.3
MGFLDNLFKDDKKGGGENNKKKSNNNGGNPLGNMFGGRPRTFHGTGQSLGGTQPGTVLPIVLMEPGPLGVRVEKRPNSAGSTAIVNQIVPGGQAEAAGMQRGDILCFAGSNGQEEIMYDMFLEMAKSTQRPIHLEVRRISTLLDKQQKQQKQQQSSFNNQSADAEARRKAVIAAAEAREKKHKTQSKPMKQVTKSTLAKERQQQQELLAANNTNSLETEIPISEASRKAALAAKQSEAQVAAQLGYNPYETSRATAGQARNATTTVQHGALSSYSPDQQDELPFPNVAPPRNATEEDGDEDDTFGGPPPSEEFQHAFATVLSDADKDKVRSSLTIMTKLLINATTKQDEAKFRKVRLANAKIKSAIVDMEGAIDLMMSCGFVLQEQDGESVLIYPEKEVYKVPEWIPAAIRQMEKAQK